ncbi:tyrosine-type recombinase/integrase [Bradyrhizobium sp. SSUT77]|uniref:tyrosine-type recombinase/integrase n=1 Tax=Bradyrhizobium sp. SSUT77 TaxID=3040603 RepID=UPI00244B0167|nr:tyrosine-type recombinase/integrase [Bradyrhizobium sp. SSUT77]MDH2341270.1 tyrosine-type recombinase/integrase [Bradyrhizobium sp. SSUT77]
MIAAGVTVPTPVLDGAGKPIINNAGNPVMRDAPKYGMHSLRHACASLWIESGNNPKRIQKLMGHSTIQMTFDTYATYSPMLRQIRKRQKTFNCGCLAYQRENESGFRVASVLHALSGTRRESLKSKRISNDRPQHENRPENRADTHRPC